jgi:hyperosmotically inducible protein
MKPPIFQANFWVTGILFGFLLLGCGSPDGASPVFSAPSGPGASRSFSTTWNDSVICTRVKSRMISDDFIIAGPIGVDVYNGVVYLTGTVETDSQKRMAADLARGVEGVVSVVNDLTFQN